jgi:hypothetical protein
MNHQSNQTELKIEGETTPTKQWSENLRDEAIMTSMKPTINRRIRNKPDNRRRILMKTTNPEQKPHICVSLFLNHTNNGYRDRTQQLKLELTTWTKELQSDRNSTYLDGFKTQTKQKLWMCEKNIAYCGQGGDDCFNYPKKGLGRWR